MNLWKPTTRKTKKVSHTSNISGADVGSHNSIANSGVRDHWLDPLPDVVANLNLNYFAETQHPTVAASVSMLGTRDIHYPEMGESRVRRRDARPPPPPVTPQGLGATPQGLGAAPQGLGVAPSPAMISPNGGGGIACGGWRNTNPQHQWASPPQQQHPEPLGGVPAMTTGAGLSAACGVPVEVEGARLRSVSSEPRGPAGSGGDRRVRCSSASRCRQHRPCPPPGDRPPGMATMPPPHSPPPNSPPPPTQTLSLHSGGHPPYSQTAGATPSGSGVGVVGGVLARLAGCYENLESGRDPGEGGAYGYQVSDLEALLTRASPSRPANLPMVLASSTRLHNMRRTPEPASHNQPPVRPFLPLGIIVNAVFKTRDWLYVRTAHGAEGYVPYRVCLPLGILPPPREGHSMPPGMASEMTTGDGVWESRTDMFSGAVVTQSPNPPPPPPSLTTPLAPMGGVGSDPPPVGQTRGRSRGRRRPPCAGGGGDSNCNQTDSQKLQPRGRSVSESRSPRETLDAPGQMTTTAPDHILV